MALASAVPPVSTLMKLALDSAVPPVSTVMLKVKGSHCGVRCGSGGNCRGGQRAEGVVLVAVANDLSMLSQLMVWTINKALSANDQSF